MLQKIGYSLLCAGALFSANALAMTHTLMPGAGIEYKLPPNKPEEFSNPAFFAIKATCLVHTQDESNDIFIEALSKSGKINEENITAGQSLTFTVHSGDILTITANPGAKVRLTNQGLSTVSVSCSIFH